MNVRTLSTSKVYGRSLNISAASLSCHIPVRRGGETIPTILFPTKRRHIGRSQDSEAAPLWLGFLFGFGFFFPQVLQIAPESGVVQPGESIPCFITLRPSESASFYSIDLVCKVRPKRYTCITITSACHCSPQMAGPSSQLPAASS